MKKEFTHIHPDYIHEYEIVDISREESLTFLGRDKIEHHCDFINTMPGDLIWTFSQKCILHIPIMQVEIIARSPKERDSLFISIYKNDLVEDRYLVYIPKPHTYESLIKSGYKAVHVMVDTYTIGNSEGEYGSGVYQEMYDIVRILRDYKTPKKRVANKMKNKLMKIFNMDDDIGGPSLPDYWIKTFGSKKNIPIFPRLRPVRWRI
jgi:hypothetical protein